MYHHFIVHFHAVEFRSAQDDDAGFSGQVIRSAASGGSYTLVKIHEVGTETRAMFRMVLPDDGGFNYHNAQISDFAKVREPRNTIAFQTSDVRTLADEQKGGFGQDFPETRPTKAGRF